MFLKCRFVSSLEKVFCRPELPGESISGVSGAQGETVSFQLAVMVEEEHRRVEFHADSPFGEALQLRRVGLVPCLKPAPAEDSYVITSLPGVFPDPLFPLENNAFRVTAGHWFAVWCTVRIPDDFEPGKYEVKFNVKAFYPIYNREESRLDAEKELTFQVEVLPFRLPAQKLLATHWFHTDCIYTYYGVPCWSEDHWRLLGKYFRDLSLHGNNLLLTPLWTPPLDTKVGKERPTAQLLEISCADGQYSFDFARLKRWVDLAKQNGITAFEMSHAFTQWGARATPKIMVRENGREVRKFGWDVPASDPEYKNFLSQLMPKLLAFLRENGLTPENTFFHVSDEPTSKMLEDYRYASTLLNSLLEGYPVIDALSNIEFYRKGLIRRPIPATNEVEEFAQENLEQRWTYYAGNWQNNVPNRSYGMPSLRNRVLGILLYIYRMEGFLHWGYNFWFSVLSENQHLNPYLDTDVDTAFCGGSSYLVYPGPDGPVDSLRYEVFNEAMQDLRACQYLESLAGRDKVMELIQQGTSFRVCMTYHPKDAEWLLDLRARINAEIVRQLAAGKR